LFEPLSDPSPLLLTSLPLFEVLLSSAGGGVGGDVGVEELEPVDVPDADEADAPLGVVAMPGACPSESAGTAVPLMPVAPRGATMTSPVDVSPDLLAAVTGGW
jgi:hypothetical protein